MPPAQMNLENKVVVVTGASSGIGYHLAKLLPKENCSIALISRRKNILEQIVNELKNSSINIKAYQCDVGKFDEVQNTFKEIKKDFGKIDVAILNAGISSRTDIRNYSSENAREIFNTNTLGIVNCIEQLLPDFIERKDGMIVGVSSLAESRGFPGSGFYNASKSAVTLLLESIRIELKKYNIKVIIVKPGFVKSPMTDKNEFYMPFLMDIEKAVKIILNGIKKEKKIIQFPLPVVIGAKVLKFMPNFLFDFLMSKQLPPRKS
jgi:short-subunit dehydrogenase